MTYLRFLWMIVRPVGSLSWVSHPVAEMMGGGLLVVVFVNLLPESVPLWVSVPIFFFCMFLLLTHGAYRILQSKDKKE